MDFSTQTLFVKLDYENTFIVFTWALSLQEVVELAVSNRVLGLRSLSNSSLMQIYICQLTFDPVPSSPTRWSLPYCRPWRTRPTPVSRPTLLRPSSTLLRTVPSPSWSPIWTAWSSTYMSSWWLNYRRSVCQCVLFFCLTVYVLKTFQPTRYFSATVLYGLAVRPFWEIKGLFSTTGFSRCRNLLLNVRLHLKLNIWLIWLRFNLSLTGVCFDIQARRIDVQQVSLSLTMTFLQTGRIIFTGVSSPCLTGRCA